MLIILARSAILPMALRQPCSTWFRALLTSATSLLDILAYHQKLYGLTRTDQRFRFLKSAIA